MSELDPGYVVGVLTLPIAILVVYPALRRALGARVLYVGLALLALSICIAAAYPHSPPSWLRCLVASTTVVACTLLFLESFRRLVERVRGGGG